MARGTRHHTSSNISEHVNVAAPRMLRSATRRTDSPVNEDYRGNGPRKRRRSVPSSVSEADEAEGADEATEAEPTIEVGQERDSRKASPRRKPAARDEEKNNVDPASSAPLKIGPPRGVKKNSAPAARADGNNFEPAPPPAPPKVGPPKGLSKNSTPAMRAEKDDIEPAVPLAVGPPRGVNKNSTSSETGQPSNPGPGLQRLPQHPKPEVLLRAKGKERKHNNEDDEDDEDDEEFELGAIGDGDVSSDSGSEYKETDDERVTGERNSSRQDAPQVSRHESFNGKTVGTSAVAPDHNTNPSERKPGVWPSSANADVQAFQDRIVKEADELGKRYGKSRRDVLVKAGFGLKSSRESNSWNMYSSWYAHHYKKPTNKEEQDRFVQHAKASYLKLYKEGDDEEARAKVWAPIQKWWDERQFSLPDNNSLKSVGTRIRQCKEQLASIAEAHAIGGEMQVLGVVCYTGRDADCHKHSGLFSSSRTVAQWIKEGNTEVLQVIDLLNLILKTSSLKEGLAQLGLTQVRSEASLLIRKPGEHERDRQRRAFKLMANEKLEKYFDLPAGERMKFKWQTFLDECYRKRIIITKWPDHTSAPGPGFTVKGLKPAELSRIVVSFIKRKMGVAYDGDKDDQASEGGNADEYHPEWECHYWADEWHDIPDVDPRKGDIPLVSNGNGFTIWALSDCERWADVHKKALEKQRPFLEKKPQHSQVHNIRHDSERPHKRSRETIEDDDEVVERIWAEYGPERHMLAPHRTQPEQPRRQGSERDHQSQEPRQQEVPRRQSPALQHAHGMANPRPRPRPRPRYADPELPAGGLPSQKQPEPQRYPRRADHDRQGSQDPRRAPDARRPDSHTTGADTRPSQPQREPESHRGTQEAHPVAAARTARPIIDRRREFDESRRQPGPSSRGQQAQANRSSKPQATHHPLTTARHADVDLASSSPASSSTSSPPLSWYQNGSPDRSYSYSHGPPGDLVFHDD
ncbi:hypothetical protein BU15DRAFT_81889 [Melanogaster broomeanus]|nr:hypothetical protein BU15DRAFT_81889 [Melanogaster broomeanus]